MKIASKPEPTGFGAITPVPPKSAVRALGGRLLLVDDEAPLLRGLVRLMSLAAPSWRVRAVFSAEAALESLCAEPAQVLLTDLEMPGMGGASLLEEVSKLYPAMVRVIHSSHVSPEVAKLAHFVLEKPVKSEVLLATVQEAFAMSLGQEAKQASL